MSSSPEKLVSSEKMIESSRLLSLEFGVNVKILNCALWRRDQMHGKQKKKKRAMERTASQGRGNKYGYEVLLKHGVSDLKLQKCARIS